MLHPEMGYHLAFWAQRWTNLEVLNLDGWQGQGDIGLAYLLRSCRTLRFLSLRFCSGLSEASLIALGERHPSPLRVFTSTATCNLDSRL